MKRLIWLVILVAVTFVGRLTAQSRPDFSGTWTGPERSLTIRQDGATLTVGEGTETRIYNLDGSESRFFKNDTKYTAWTRWVGSALVIATTTVSSIGTWEDLEVYSLDYGPKLTVVYVGTQTTRPMMFTQTKTYQKR
jgi:hypothetical protein